MEVETKGITFQKDMHFLFGMFLFGFGKRLTAEGKKHMDIANDVPVEKAVADCTRQKAKITKEVRKLKEEWEDKKLEEAAIDVC